VSAGDACITVRVHEIQDGIPQTWPFSIAMGNRFPELLQSWRLGYNPRNIRQIIFLLFVSQLARCEQIHQRQRQVLHSTCPTCGLWHVSEAQLRLTEAAPRKAVRSSFVTNVSKLEPNWKQHSQNHKITKTLKHDKMETCCAIIHREHRHADVWWIWPLSEHARGQYREWPYKRGYQFWSNYVPTQPHENGGQQAAQPETPVGHLTWVVDARSSTNDPMTKMNNSTTGDRKA